MKYGFVYDERLGIPLPELYQEWEMFSEEERSVILREWEEIRGRIPDRIKALEQSITAKQNRLNEEDNFAVSCRLNTEIAELASRITDLHLWYRIDQDVYGKAHH
jgi:dynactin complex subunit